MKEIIRFFELKNDYLEKFLNLTRVCIMKLENGINVNLEYLKNNRENILSIIDHVDKKIVEILGTDPNSKIAASLMPDLADLIFTKDNLVKEIVTLDAKLMKLVEDKKEEVRYEISKLKDLGEAINSYTDTKDSSGVNLNIEK